MTDAEWPALDRAAAEKVMGWHRETKWWPERVTWESDDKKIIHSWQPTRDIAQAMQVLEHFPWPQFYVSLHHTYSGLWRCDIELNGGDGPVCSGNAETAPLAIVLAALSAGGHVEVSG